MEVSLIGSSQGTFYGGERTPCRELRFSCVPSRNGEGLSFFDRSSRRCRNSRLRLNVTAGQTEPVRSDCFPVHDSAAKPDSIDRVRLFVGLPLDVVSDCNSVNHARAITAGLKALKLLGVEGVELPLWWGLVEKEGMGKYDWSGYLAVAEMVQNAELKLHVTLNFHASKQAKVSLPEWVSKIGESNPSIFYRARSGEVYKDCLSLGVDDLPVLHGKSPVQVYKDFCESFRASFGHFLGSTVTGVTMGLGPDGELRYPSHHKLPNNGNVPGIGEFQCYDKNMMNKLKQHAEASGCPLWGLAGPHDAPNYDQSAESNTFFKEQSGSWETPYGDFFLSWYSNQLLTHGDRLLSMASDVFTTTGVATHGMIPLMHSWYRTRSRGLENTAGFYNSASKDGYEPVAEMFGRYSCGMIVPGMDLADDNQPHKMMSSPELLLGQIKDACKRHGVRVSGMNSNPVSNAAAVEYGFDQIRKNMDVVELFTYQRMGAEFFSPEHFPSFTQFARSLSQPAKHSDDLPLEKIAESVPATSESSIEMQTA
ncbi:Inactive beta-amylase 9 [Linum perenne]